MTNKIVKIIRKLCIAFVMLYGLNVILSSLDIFIPINLISLFLVTGLGCPGIIGLVLMYFFI